MSSNPMTLALLMGDVALLDDEGCEDPTLALLAAEHAARIETLIKCMQCPSRARAVLLTLTRALLNVGHQIDLATVQQPELVDVG